MSDETPDSRPRPQYGEYATPEEQRARMRPPGPAAQAAAAPPAQSAPPAPTWGASSLPGTKPAPKPGPWPEATPGTRERKPHPVDRIVTLALLAYGLINVITSIPSLVDNAAYTETVFKLLGVNATLSDPAAGKPWGFAAALVMALGWLITAWLSWLSLRRGRLTWWIPLVGGFVFTFVSGVLMLVPLMNDPAVWTQLVNSIR
jgi:hypothetical protein